MSGTHLSAEEAPEAPPEVWSGFTDTVPEAVPEKLLRRAPHVVGSGDSGMGRGGG